MTASGDAGGAAAGGFASAGFFTASANSTRRTTGTFLSNFAPWRGGEKLIVIMRSVGFSARSAELGLAGPISVARRPGDLASVGGGGGGGAFVRSRVSTIPSVLCGVHLRARDVPRCLRSARLSRDFWQQHV